PIRLIRDDVLVDDVLEVVLANVRTPAIRRADLLAQVAANSVGAERLLALVDRHGLAFVRSAFDEVIASGERRTRDVLRTLPDGPHAADGEVEGDGVDDVDIPIRFAVTIAGDSMLVGLAGTSGPVAGNVNCPLSVTRSACLFALRVLLPADVPIN